MEPDGSSRRDPAGRRVIDGRAHQYHYLQIPHKSLQDAKK